MIIGDPTGKTMAAFVRAGTREMPPINLTDAQFADIAVFVLATAQNASGRRPATRFLTSSFLTGNYPGRPPADANTGDDTKAAWEDFYADFTAHPPKYFVDTSPAKVRGSQYYPISDFPRLEHIVDTQYRYVVTIDGIDVYKRK